MAATNPFCYGTFRLYEGKTAYNLSEVRIAEYFENLREDFEGAFTVCISVMWQIIIQGKITMKKRC